MPKYKQRLKREAPVQREVMQWTHQSEASLQDALNDGDMFQHSSYDDMSMFTEALMEFIGKLVDNTVLEVTIRMFPNQKPWVDKTICDTLKLRKATSIWTSIKLHHSMSRER